jgi:hypothetical protein
MNFRIIYLFIYLNQIVVKWAKHTWIQTCSWLNVVPHVNVCLLPSQRWVRVCTTCFCLHAHYEFPSPTSPSIRGHARQLCLLLCQKKIVFAIVTHALMHGQETLLAKNLFSLYTFQFSLCRLLAHILLHLLHMYTRGMHYLLAHVYFHLVVFRHPY